MDNLQLGQGVTFNVIPSIPVPIAIGTGQALIPANRYPKGRDKLCNPEKTGQALLPHEF
jgi:hypothetical protein